MLAQMVAGAALAVAVAAISQRIFGNWMAGLIAGILVAVHPGFVLYNSTKAHTLAFDALFFALALWQSFRLAERPTLRRALVFGLIIGVGTLSRGTVILMGPLGGLWLLARSPKESRMILFRRLVFAGVIAAVIIAPWTIRNSLIHHRFVFLISTESEDFWLGNNPNATGHTLIDAQNTVFMSLSNEERLDLYRQPNEMAQADWFSRRSRAFVKAHPGTVSASVGRKVFSFLVVCAANRNQVPRQLVLSLHDLLFGLAHHGGGGRGTNPSTRSAGHTSGLARSNFSPGFIPTAKCLPRGRPSSLGDRADSGGPQRRRRRFSD